MLGIRDCTFFAVNLPVSWSSDNVRNDQSGSSREQGARILPAVQPGLRGGQKLSACEAVALSGSRVPMTQKGVGFVIFFRSLVYHLCSQCLEEVTAFPPFLVGNQSLSA